MHEGEHQVVFDKKKYIMRYILWCIKQIMKDQAFTEADAQCVVHNPQDTPVKHPAAPMNKQSLTSTDRVG